MITQKQVTICICERCGHQWIPTVEGKLPVMCPKCKSHLWNQPKKSKV